VNGDRDPRAVAEEVFRDRLGPVLVLAERYPDASDVFIDGDTVRVCLGDERLALPISEFGLTRRAVEAAGAAAAVFAGVEFGPSPPARPLLSVKIPPDLRVTFVRPPAADGWHVDIRFLRTRALTLDDYVRQGVMTPDQPAEVRSLLRTRKTVVVSGGTGTGKTTLLRALLAEVADRERLVVIEDTPELAVPGENVVQLQTTLNVDLAQLLRQTLRLTPDRIVLGEVRGPEALELVRAMNTGHDGTLCTLHSNGAGEALRRLHTLVAEAQPGFPFGGVLSAVDHVLQLEGRGDGRRLADIWPVPRGGSGEEHGRRAARRRVRTVRQEKAPAS
jgi:type IV secretion system protein VirB11